MKKLLAVIIMTIVVFPTMLLSQSKWKDRWNGIE